MLLAGPALIAKDKASQSQSASPYQTTTAAPDPKALFKSNCGSCHTLAAAGTSGQVGPKLDHLGFDAATIEKIMQSGPGVMPSFTSTLSPAELKAVAKLVAGS